MRPKTGGTRPPQVPGTGGGKVTPAGAGSNKNDSNHKSKGHNDAPQSGNEKKRNPGGLKNKTYGAFGGYKGVKYGEAAALVNPQIRKQINQLKRERRKIRQGVRDDRQDINNNYEQTVGDLNYIYSESGEFIQSQNDLINQQYEANRTKAEQAQAALAAQLAANGANNAAGVDSELARLGIGGSGNMGQFAADQSYAQNTAALSGADNLANLGLMAQGSATVGSLLAGMNKGSQASQLGQALNTKNDALQELKNNKMDSFLQVNQAIKDAKATRPELINSMLNQLAQTGWAQFVDSKNLSMQQQQLNLQKQAQAFAQRQALAASGGGYGGGSTSSGSSSSGSVSSPTPPVSQPPAGPKKPPKKGRNSGGITTPYDGFI